MTGSDLIVAAPWIIFGVALLGLCIPLIRARRASRRRDARSRPPGEEPRRAGKEPRGAGKDPRGAVRR